MVRIGEILLNIIGTIDNSTDVSRRIRTSAARPRGRR